MANIRVLLADDHSVLRSGLRLLLDAQPDMEVVGEAADGSTALELARALHPDVVLLDISMPGLGGIEATRRLRQAAPGARVLILTMHDDAGYLAAVMGAGASGYVVKKVANAELISAIRAVHHGVMAFSGLTTGGGAGAGGGLEAGPGRSDPASPDLALLSEREREVLGLLALGHTSQEIAGRLYLSVKTVETYKGRLMEKLGLKRRSDLVRFALSHGLVSLEE